VLAEFHRYFRNLLNFDADPVNMKEYQIQRFRHTSFLAKDASKNSRRGVDLACLVWYYSQAL
jgi:hypothetical protein